ncbi:putative sodium bile acid cotransporter [Paecilomyces variotii]|uniref:Putative sodium bile acid cotransporter n=1 Tax=Byssochlamys spectabilis TaxID=264951 RepID=A0A443HS26_BYSSP|nr:putative sodium bile acid cotransporter [Paecilomyces variotii]KAJ9362932.1 hypothetical protein DTO280E4_3281 [Paecilomyces variotii]RWQ94646.1 putative sodium bile acid cotransporter [Paecilomyces variotii]
MANGGEVAGAHNEKRKSKKTRGVAVVKKVLLFLLHQWLLIGMGVVCVLAYFFPNVAKQGGIIRTEYSILYGAVALIFLISGLSIPRQKLFKHMLNWRLHVLVQVTSFLFIPALVLAIVHIVLAGDPWGHIDRAVLAGYILVACIPTTIASNVVMTRAAGGDDAAALVEVLVANVLGPFVTAGWTVTLIPNTPEFSAWKHGEGALNQMYRDVFKQLGLAVLIPLAVGQLIRWTWSDQTAWVLQKFKVAKVGTFCLLLLIWTTFSTCFATDALESLSAQSIVFVVLFNIALYLFLTVVCFVISRPPKCLSTLPWGRRIFKRVDPEETIAICFCGPAKTTALGIPLLYAMWSSVDLFTKAKTSVPVLLYTTEQVCVAHFMVYIFRRWHSRLQKKQDMESIGEPESHTGTTDGPDDASPLDSKEVGSEPDRRATEIE